jgi:serine/threonine protein kinase
MGAVYRALDTALNRFVAVKVMKAALGEDAKLVASFIREAQAAAALNHRNIVQIYSCGQEKGQPYIVMELVTGGKMNHMFTKEQPMDEVKLLKIAIDVAEGLKAANDVGLVHGDIKPENVLIDHSGTAKIVDFGLAQFVNAQKERGEIWGTPYYISPERARGNKADHRSDIYSLGATMFHALSGQPPFDGKTAVDVVLARLKHPPPELKKLRPELRPETVELIDRMMAADPYLRYPNSSSLKSDMNNALHAAKEALTKTKPKGHKSNRSSLVIAGLAIALLAGAGITMFTWYRAEKAKPKPVASQTEKKKNTPVAKEKTEEPKDDILTVTEVKGKDGKVRLRMDVRFFSPEEEAALVDALSSLAGDDVMVSHRKITELSKKLTKQNNRIMWFPVLQAVPLWAANEDARARAGLEQVVSKFKSKEKDDHPIYMPLIISRYLLGTLDDGELSKYRQIWPAWFGDIIQLLSGVQELQKGNVAEGRRKLGMYTERSKAEPAWVYAFRPAVNKWNQSMLDLEDVRRQVNRQLESGMPGAARATLEAFQKEAPPMLADSVAEGLKKIAETEQQQKQMAGEAAARARRVAVQQDLDRVDSVLAELSPLIVRSRDYRKASISMSTLPADMKTDEGREAAQWARDLVDAMDGLKSFLIRGIDVLPYTRADGSDFGGDVISANSLGIKISLDGRAITTRPWDTIPVRSYIKMVEFYANDSRFTDKERADAFTALAVFSLINGAFEPAGVYARRAASIQPDLARKLRRLLPGLIQDV